MQKIIQEFVPKQENVETTNNGSLPESNLESLINNSEDNKLHNYSRKFLDEETNDNNQEVLIQNNPPQPPSELPTPPPPVPPPPSIVPPPPPETNNNEDLLQDYATQFSDEASRDISAEVSMQKIIKEFVPKQKKVETTNNIPVSQNNFVEGLNHTQENHFNKITQQLPNEEMNSSELTPPPSEPVSPQTNEQELIQQEQTTQFSDEVSRDISPEVSMKNIIQEFVPKQEETTENDSVSESKLESIMKNSQKNENSTMNLAELPPPPSVAGAPPPPVVSVAEEAKSNNNPVSEQEPHSKIAQNNEVILMQKIIEAIKTQKRNSRATEVSQAIAPPKIHWWKKAVQTIKKNMPLIGQKVKTQALKIGKKLKNITRRRSRAIARNNVTKYP